MQRPNQCPRCQTMRPPNARFCPSCGHDMDVQTAEAGWVVPPSQAAAISIDVSFWTAVKVGAGLVVGVAFVSVGIWVVLGLLIMIGINLPAAPR